MLEYEISPNLFRHKTEKLFREQLEKSLRANIQSFDQFIYKDYTVLDLQN